MEYCNDFANHVICVPVNVGDMVFIPWTWNDDRGIAFAEVECIQIVRDSDLCGFYIDLKSDDIAFNEVYGFWRSFNDIGEKIFLSRVDAENYLLKFD